RYAIGKVPLTDRTVEAVAAALAAATSGSKDSVVIISADASATHQSVITVMEAARRAGLMQVTFATQSAAQAGR
ncbi:biopolymer transporter ExbD, partial [Escherichia coli]|uniref:ExbD/TolR family protein n=1 Tax=Escherichia coli TaxID=562 RepID=UPI0021576E22